jgi:hypothetical protein
MAMLAMTRDPAPVPVTLPGRVPEGAPGCMEPAAPAVEAVGELGRAGGPEAASAESKSRSRIWARGAKVGRSTASELPKLPAPWDETASLLLPPAFALAAPLFLCLWTAPLALLHV